MKNRPEWNRSGKWETFEKLSSWVCEEQKHDKIAECILTHSINTSCSDLGAVFCGNNTSSGSQLPVLSKNGYCDVPDFLPKDGELYHFVDESKESVVLSRSGRDFFREILLHESMKSGMAIPLCSSTRQLRGILILNSVRPYHFSGERFRYLQSFSGIASKAMNKEQEA